MGGGIESKIRYNNHSSADDLDLIYLAVDPILGNQTFFDRSILYKKFCLTAKKYFRENGVKCIIEGPAPLGGGGPGFVWDILKRIPYNEILGTLFLIVKDLILKQITGSPFNDRPRVFVSLRFNSNLKMNSLSYKDVETILIDRLINLKNLSDGLCDLLDQRYPIFVFDQSIGAAFYTLGFRVKYFIPKEKRTDFNRTRLIRIFKSTKIKNNLCISYTFNKFNFIEKICMITKYLNGAWISEKPRKHFLFFP